MYDFQEPDSKEPIPAVGAWSNQDFALRARSDPVLTKFSQELYEAALDNRLVIWLGPGGVFRNAGLCLGILDPVPEVFAEEMLAAELDAIRLPGGAEATGIKQFLVDAAGGQEGFGAPFRYFALSPRWASKDNTTPNGRSKTEYDVVFWLNPWDQKDNNSAWVTVEDLMAWTEGKGPIPKNPKTD
jgi:hypothetical protein